MGAGYVKAAFEADPERSFNRGYTDYFFVQRKTGHGEHGFPEVDGEEGGRGEAGEGKPDVGGASWNPCITLTGCVTLTVGNCGE